MVWTSRFTDAERIGREETCIDAQASLFTIGDSGKRRNRNSVAGWLSRAPSDVTRRCKNAMGAIHVHTSTR